MKTALIKLMKELAKRLAKKKAKDKVNDGSLIRMILITLLVIIGAIGSVIALAMFAINIALNGIICKTGVFGTVLGKVNPIGEKIDTKEACPLPPLDDKEVQKLAKEIFNKRNGLKTFESKGDKFQSSPDPESGKETYMSAYKFLIAFEQLDTEVRYLQEDRIDGIEDSNYAKTLKTARGKDESFWRQLSKKDLNRYFMEERLKVWKCFLLGDSCGGDTGELVPEEYRKHLNSVDIKKVCNEENDCTVYYEFKYQTFREMLNRYYEISLYNGLPEGEELFEQRVQDILTVLYNEFPEMNTSGNFGIFSNGWILPMEPGTYNYKYGSGQEFGMRGDIGVSGASSDHKGVDFGTSGQIDVPIYAIKEGVVTAVQNSTSAGATVMLKHPDGLYSRYLHMSMDQIVVKVGQSVVQGQMIGAVNTKGYSSGPHLHWEICRKANGIACSEQINPEAPEIGLVIQDTADMSKQQERVKFYKENKEAAKSGKVILMPGFDPMMNNLGSVSAEFESSGDPGMCVDNYPRDPGGLSCGAYQFALTPDRSYSTLFSFVQFMQQNYPEYNTYFGKYKTKRSLKLETFGADFKKAYEEFGNAFVQIQHNYIAKTHYLPQVEKIRNKYNYDLLKQKRSIQEMMWSYSVQHNNNAPIDWGITIGSNGNSMTNREIVTKMYDYRYSKYSCCGPRYIREKAKVLELVAQEEKEEKTKETEAEKSK